MTRKTLKQVKELFQNDSLIRKTNKSANNVILNLIALINNDSAIIECGDMSRGGNIPSRGIVAECLVKMYYKNTKSAKWSSSGYDFTYNGVHYEVKCSTSKGYAHYNPKQDLSHLIFVDSTGIYETTGDNIILDKCKKHIQTIKINKNVKCVVSF